MAQFNVIDADLMKSLTDCVAFMDSHCVFAETCRYRHSFEARKQLSLCRNWPDMCRRIQCRFRHPAILLQPKATALNFSVPSLSADSVVSFFWDIENVSIPKGQRPFDIVQRIRQKLVLERGLQEVDFSCYCDTNTISQENQQSLSHATVRIVHVPDRKPGAVDRQIMLDLDRFERTHRPPATIVLISGDIDFVGKLSDLRLHAGFYVIVIHNRPAKQELKATVNEHYPWELFTNAQATSSTRAPYFNNNQIVYDNHFSQPTSAPRSTRTQPRKSLSNSRNNDNFNYRNATKSSTSLSSSIQQQPVRAIHDRDVNSVPSFTSDMNQPSFPVYYHNADYNVPQYPSSFTMIPEIPMHRPTNYSHFESNNTPPRPIRRGENRTNRKRKEERNTPRDCSFCEAEFGTIQALRQHQEDKGHLYLCPMCNQGFFTYEGQVQHKKAKGHGSDDETHNSTENYVNHRSRNYNQFDAEDNDTSDNRSTGPGRESATELSSGSIVLRGFIEIVRELFK